MKLFRVHAYSVSPKRGAEAPADPEGGVISINAELRRVIYQNLRSAQLQFRGHHTDFFGIPGTQYIIRAGD